MSQIPIRDYRATLAKDFAYLDFDLPDLLTIELGE
jgi:hypothetical protein